MIQLALIYSVPALALAGLVWCFTRAVYQNRLIDAKEQRDAARGDADGLAEALRGLQAALAAGIPVDVDSFSPVMPRTEAIFSEGIERDLRRSRLLAARVRRSLRRDRAASQA